MSPQVREIASKKKETANEILRDTNAIALFSEIGTVEIVGSLRLDLMYRNDIDLLVISDGIQKDNALKVTKKLIDSNHFQTVAIADYQTYPEGDFPNGYYWELIVVKDNEKWKFDVWYLSPDEEYAKLVLSSIEKFEIVLKEHPEKRKIILEIKDEYFDGVKYKDRVKSIDIYRAVLENNINSVEEFSRYISSH